MKNLTLDASDQNSIKYALVSPLKMNLDCIVFTLTTTFFKISKPKWWKHIKYILVQKDNFIFPILLLTVIEA